MDIWKILGIEKTDDEDAIKAAYLARLADHHPEEDPDGFMELRSSFEQAMSGREQEEQGPQADPQVLPWMERMEEVYADFGKRIDPEAWKKLLNDPLCIGLETAELVNQAFLRFLMDHHYIPHKVWKLLAEHLGWSENRSALCQEFPENFIDYVLNQATYEDNFRYGAFELEPGKDYDAFVRGFFALCRAIDDQDEEKAEACLNGMLDMDIRHPDFLQQQVRYCLKIEEDAEAAWRRAQEIEVSFDAPVDSGDLYWYLTAGLAVGRGEELKPYVDRLLLLDGGHAEILKLAGDYHAAVGEYQMAILCYDQAGRVDENIDLDDSRSAVYEVLSHRYEEELQKNPSDRMKYRTARACYYGGRYDRTRELLLSMEETAGIEDTVRWWLADSSFELEEYEEAEAYCDEILRHSPTSENALPLKIRLLSMRSAYEEIVRLAGPALEKGYRSVSVVFNYACALRRTGQYDKAGEWLGILEEQIGRHPSVVLEYARLYDDTERYDDAMECVDELLERDPSDVSAIYLKAGILCSMDRYQEAFDIYREQVDAGRESYYENYRLGYVCFCMRNYEDAEHYYRRTLEYAPDHRGAMNELGDTLQKLGRMDEAVEYYAKAIADGYRNARWLWDLIRLLRRMGRYEEALEYCKTGMKEFPDDGRFYEMAGMNARGLKRYEEAIGYFETYGEVDDRQDALTRIAYCYEKSGMKEKAEEIYLKGTEEFPEEYDSWHSLGVFYKDEKRYEEALEAFLKALELSSDSAYRLICIGVCYENLGDAGKAEESYRRSLELALSKIEKRPFSPCNYEAAAEAYSHLGDKEKTVEMAEKALELHLEHFGCPKLNCYEAYQDMGRICETKGELEEALGYYEEAWDCGKLDEDKETVERLRKMVEGRE